MKINAVVFCGGNGAKSIIDALKHRTQYEFDITVVINAYDDGKSTGKVRADFNVLGPSDARKNLAHLLDAQNLHTRLFRDFFSLRLEDQDLEYAELLLRAIANGDVTTLTSRGDKWKIFQGLPAEFRQLVSAGMRQYLEALSKNAAKTDYADFNLMNAVFAGLMGAEGCLQKVTEQLSAAMPLQGKVLLNSVQNLYLYALRETADRTTGIVQDEADIVSSAYPRRIIDLFLLPSPLSQDRKQYLETLSPEKIQASLSALSVTPLLNPQVKAALNNADLIIYAPGTPHSSLYPTYLTGGLTQCIADNTHAVKLFIANIREDVDIRAYSASELLDTAISYLRRSVNNHVPITSLISDIFINTPVAPDQTHIHPGLDYFRQSSPFRLAKGNGFPPEIIENNREIIRVLAADMEHANQSGKHDPEKLMMFMSSIMPVAQPTRLPHQLMLRRGAILFDVDQTVLDVRIDPVAQQKFEETLLESPILGLIAELLEKGFQLCAITGNDLEKFHRRFTHILIDRLKRENKLHLMQGFEVYGNGAATHLTFDSCGNFCLDEIYNRSFQIPPEEIKIIYAVLEDIILRIQRTFLADREQLMKEYDPGKWIYAYHEANRKWFAEENGIKKELPWIENRGNGVMITVKPIPSHKHIRNPNLKSLRRIVLEMIQDRLREALGERYARFAFVTGGWSSIEITLRVTKAVAVKHYLDCHHLKPEDVIYFGNEFKKYGNDQPVLEKIENIHVVSVNQPEDEIFFQNRVIFGGARGVFSTAFQFSSLLELYQKAEIPAHYPPQEQAAPIIQQMIQLSYKEKIIHREKLIQQKASQKELMHHYQFILQVQNSTLRMLHHKPALIIPAAGKGSRLEADAPKALYRVAGKPSLLHVLDLFSNFAGQIIILINSSHRPLFEQALKGRDETITLIHHDIQSGEGRAVLDALPHVADSRRDVIVAWADLVKGNQEKIRRTIEAHYAADNPMTFPTMWEPHPYVAILRDERDRVCRAAFRQSGEIHVYGEHDCSFFILNRKILEQGMTALHDRHFDPNTGVYNFSDPGTQEKSGAEFRFLYLLQYLYEEGQPATALPICKRDEFLGFNTKQEARWIEEESEFSPTEFFLKRFAE